MLSLIREEPAMLEVDLHAGCLRYKGREVDIDPSRLALYAFFAMGKRTCTRESGCRACSDCYLSMQRIMECAGEIADIYRQHAGTRELTAMSDSGILALSKQNFNSYRSKIKRQIEAGFGMVFAGDLVLDSIRTQGDTRYGIRIGRERIKVIL
jgi:CRISPR-associated protein Csx14